MDAVYGRGAVKAKCFMSSSAENCLVNIVSQTTPALSRSIVPIPQPSEALLGTAPSPFLSKTYDMIDDPNTDDVVSWSSSNNSFIVWNSPRLGESILPNYFKHNNFSSFVRQLNTYGFRKVDPDRWEFAAEGFIRGQRHLLKTMHRRRYVSHQIQSHQKSGKLVISLEDRKLEGEVEQLKRSKKLLKHELAEMRQQQQIADQTLKLLGQRLAATEQRQRQIMTLLAKTSVQNPSMFANFLVHQKDANRRIGSLRIGKKRQLPKLERLTQRGDSEASSSECIILKHQNAIIDPAKAILPTDSASKVPQSASVDMACNQLKELPHGGNIEQESREHTDATSTSDSDQMGSINPSEKHPSPEFKLQVSKDGDEGFKLSRSRFVQYPEGADWIEMLESFETYNRSRVEGAFHFSASAFAEQERLPTGIENIECSEHKLMKDSDSDFESS